jgi:hypothetical protein
MNVGSMKVTNPRIEQLQAMLSLEEKRAALEQQLNEVIDQMIELKDQLFSDAAPETQPKAVATVASKAKPGRKSTPRGGLKDRILAALEAAGDKGIRVKELAQSLGTKPVNVHSWFHSTMKRNPAIKKIEGGHYKLQGSVSANGTAPKSQGNVKAAAPKAGKAARKTKAGGRSPRGELSAKILSALEGAGSEGISVTDLANTVGVNPKNVSIWFSTTGKKNKAIKKVGRGQFRLAK